MTMSHQFQSPKPAETPTTRPFWSGLQEGEVRLLQCTACHAWYWPFAACREHENEPYFTNMQWKAVAGTGRIFSFNIHLQEFNPAFPTPYVYAVVQFDQGPLFPGQVRSADGQDVWSVGVGNRVEPEIVRVDAEFSVLQFRVAEAG